MDFIFKKPSLVCPNSQIGCSFHGETVTHLQVHLGACPMRKVNCRFCGLSVSQCFLETHYWECDSGMNPRRMVLKRTAISMDNVQPGQTTVQQPLVSSPAKRQRL